MNLSPAAAWSAYLAGPLWLLPEPAPRLAALSGRFDVDPSACPIMCRVVLPVPDWWSPPATPALTSWIAAGTSAGCVVGLQGSARVCLWGHEGRPDGPVRLANHLGRRPCHIAPRDASNIAHGTIGQDDALLVLRNARLLSVEHHAQGSGRRPAGYLSGALPEWAMVLGPAMIVRLAWAVRPIPGPKPVSHVLLAGHLLTRLAGDDAAVPWSPRAETERWADVAESMLVGIRPSDAPTCLPESFGRAGFARALASASSRREAPSPPTITPAF